jgi:quinolinate synthase
MFAVAEGELPADRTFILSTRGMAKHARSCDDVYEVTVPEPTASRARAAIERMMAIR